MRATDVVLSFPVLVVILTVVALIGPSMQTIILGIGLFYWPTACRIVRGRSKFESATGVVDVAPGDALYVAAGEPHRFREITEDLVLLVVFAPAYRSRGTQAR